MRKLFESALVSLDGVTEGRERWANFDAEDMPFALEELADFGGFVLGRATYTINAMPKYVASTKLTEPALNATLLGPYTASAVARLKAEPGKVNRPG